MFSPLERGPPHPQNLTIFLSNQVQANQIGRESWFGKYLSGAAHEIYSVELFDEFREYTFGDVARAMYQDQAILFAVASTRKVGADGLWFRD